MAMLVITPIVKLGCHIVPKHLRFSLKRAQAIEPLSQRDVPKRDAFPGFEQLFRFLLLLRVASGDSGSSTPEWPGSQSDPPRIVLVAWYGVQHVATFFNLPTIELFWLKFIWLLHNKKAPFSENDWTIYVPIEGLPNFFFRSTVGRQTRWFFPMRKGHIS